jgi:hypothetical protein
MLSKKQCEVAKLMTGVDVEDNKIIFEYENTDPTAQMDMSKEIDKLVKMHNLPFDKGFGIMKDDFLAIASRYAVNPATLFCFYMKHFGAVSKST